MSKLQDHIKLKPSNVKSLKTMIDTLYPIYQTRICIPRGLIFIKNASNEEKSYPWFQFIMTHLSEKIFFKNPFKHNSMDLYLSFCKNTSIYFSEGNIAPLHALHPIDYLYRKTSWNGKE